MKLIPEKNHEFARIMNCEIMKCEDPLYYVYHFLEKAGFLKKDCNTEIARKRINCKLALFSTKTETPKIKTEKKYF